MPGQVTMGLLFYPRGGSAQVVRYLAAALDRVGWETRLACGSLGAPGERTHAATFFEPITPATLDYTPAIEAWRAGRDPLAEPVPLHPSFEDRPDAPDRVFGAVSPELGDHLAQAWRAHLAELNGEIPDVLHLHHLSPLQEAFAAQLPGVPLVSHLHGTDLKMIDRIDRLAALARTTGSDLAGLAARAAAGDGPRSTEFAAQAREFAGSVRWERWPHGEHWAARLRAAARATDRFIVISPHDRDEAARLLGTDPDRVEWIPNGVDTDLFVREAIAPEERRARWRSWLVEDPHGWDESGSAGTVRYAEDDLSAFVDSETGSANPVLLFVGRFLEFKRVPLLIRAYARARERMSRRAPLVIWGGFPGEWEGEHPHTLACELGVPDVFFAGWRGHADLARGLACADVMVAPSQNEPFGQVFLEAMAAGVPVIATRSGGPLSFVNTEPARPNGWFVDVDDAEGLADALVVAVDDERGRAARAAAGHEQVRARYSWAGLTERFVEVYREAGAARA